MDQNELLKLNKCPRVRAVRAFKVWDDETVKWVAANTRGYLLGARGNMLSVVFDYLAAGEGVGHSTGLGPIINTPGDFDSNNAASWLVSPEDVEMLDDQPAPEAEDRPQYGVGLMAGLYGLCHRLRHGKITREQFTEAVLKMTEPFRVNRATEDARAAIQKLADGMDPLEYRREYLCEPEPTKKPVHYVTKACRVEFHSASAVPPGSYVFDLPAGLRCKPVSRKENTFFLDEFPEAIFPLNSLQRHDVEHYGLRLRAEQVEAVKE